MTRPKSRRPWSAGRKQAARNKRALKVSVARDQAAKRVAEELRTEQQRLKAEAAKRREAHM